MTAHFVSQSLGEHAIIFDIDVGIVEKRVGEMLSFPEKHDDDEDNDELEEGGGDATAPALQLKKGEDKDIKSKEQALSIFKPVPRENDQAAENDDKEEGSISHYSFVISKQNAKLFDSCAPYISCDALFGMIVNLLNEIYIVSGNPCIKHWPR